MTAIKPSEEMIQRLGALAMMQDGIKAGQQQLLSREDDDDDERKRE